MDGRSDYRGEMVDSVDNQTMIAQDAPTEKLRAEQLSLFFNTVMDWSAQQQVAERLALLFQDPIAGSKQDFQHQLYRALVTALLKWSNLPYGRDAETLAYRNLYQLYSNINLAYISKPEIDAALTPLSSLSEAMRLTWRNGLYGFFTLMKQGFLQAFPKRTLQGHELEKWQHIFPADCQGIALQILEQCGCITGVSTEAIRMIGRYVDGCFEMGPDAETLPRWQQWCHTFSSAQKQVLVSPYLLDLVVAAFAGRFTWANIESPCQTIPLCQLCALNPHCQWANSKALHAPSSIEETYALAGQGHTTGLSNARLIQGLFSLDEHTYERLQQQMGAQSIRDLSEYSMQQLRSLLPSQAMEVEKWLLLWEVTRRTQEVRLHEGSSIKTGWDICRHFSSRLNPLKQEQFIVILLNKRRCYITEFLITQGTLDGSLVHPREVFAHAIKERAASVILVHNHPSGNPEPSKQDLAITKKLIKAGETVGIPVLDHVIIASGGYTSMAEAGLLN